MKIKVTTTLEYNQEIKTGEDLSNIYNDFLKIINNAWESKDLTDFKFINTDTMSEIETEVFE